MSHTGNEIGGSPCSSEYLAPMLWRTRRSFHLFSLAAMVADVSAVIARNAPFQAIADRGQEGISLRTAFRRARLRKPGWRFCPVPVGAPPFPRAPAEAKSPRVGAPRRMRSRQPP